VLEILALNPDLESALFFALDLGERLASSVAADDPVATVR
jgi:hypothetical protein